MAAPSLISVTATAYNSTTTPKTTASISVESGDVLVAFAFLASGETNGEMTISGGGLTWNQIHEYGQNDVSKIYHSAWTTTATSTTSFTVTFTRVNGVSIFCGGEVHVWRGSDGIGNTNAANNTYGSGTPSVSVTTTQDNSGLSAAAGDWNAAGAATWTTTAGSVVERADFTDGSHYSVHTATYADVSTAGSKTVGHSTPTTQRYQIIVIEVKGSAAAATKAPPIFHRPMRVWTRR